MGRVKVIGGQIDLLKGTVVQIVGEEGSFYKIVPPNRAYVFLPPGSVQSGSYEAGADSSANMFAGSAKPNTNSNNW